MPEPDVFLLPDVGEGLTEADIVTWYVKVGDTVELNDVLVDVETAKSVVELPSPYAGTVVELHGAQGATLQVGSPLVSISADAPAPVAPTAPTPARATPVPEPFPVAEGAQVDAPSEDVADEAPLILVGTGPKAAVPRRIHVRPPSATAPERPRAAVGTGPSSATLPSAPPAETTRIPIKGVRKATAEAMVRSAFTAPHASMWTTVDVSASMALVRRLKADRAWAGTRVSPFLIMTRAVVLAVRRHPEVNASWDEEAQEIVLHPRVNLGIAAATPRGLIVPTIKDAASLGLAELAGTMDSLIKTAREGRTSPAEMSGGTLTITNVGTFGVEGATPILNPPEAVIVALGAVGEQPRVVDGEVVVREVMTLSISLDHRLIDGELGALFLAEIAGLLHDPARALL
jgi:pyruvate dehydrogenase E2 component (dihydrolipoamide acetyltransferase)